LQLGMIAILHTWGQNLSLHPHLHCIIPGGGIDANGKWKRKIKNVIVVKLEIWLRYMSLGNEVRQKHILSRIHLPM